MPSASRPRVQRSSAVLAKPSTTLNRVREELPRLKRAELEQVKQLVDLLLGPTKADATDDWLLGGMMYELKRRGLIRSLTGFQHMLPKDFEARSVEIRAVLLSSMEGRFNKPPLLNPVERVALGRIAARALADFFGKKRMREGVRFFFSGVSVVPEAIDASFPGYLQSGMLRMLLKVR